MSWHIPSCCSLLGQQLCFQACGMLIVVEREAITLWHACTLMQQIYSYKVQLYSPEVNRSGQDRHSLAGSAAWGHDSQLLVHC